SRTVFISSKMSFTFSTPFYIYIIIHVLYNCKCFYKIIKKIPRTRKFEVAVISLFAQGVKYKSKNINYNLIKSGFLLYN
ncbi:hypothetical protein D2T44_10470, partial [Listeria monocytogenes]|nr:hypothetical protein [Listeria monocytogenes]